MSATAGRPSAVPLATAPQLRHSTLSQVESLGQSIANIAPTLTPALNITVVAGLAATGSWLAYLIATIGMLFVGANISELAKRHPQSGSYFLYIGRNFGPFAGAMSGWSMIAAYLFTAVAVTEAFTIFLGNVFEAVGLGSIMPPAWALIVAFVVSAIVAFIAVRWLLRYVQTHRFTAFAWYRIIAGIALLALVR